MAQLFIIEELTKQLTNLRHGAKMAVLPKHGLNFNRLHGAIFKDIGRHLPSSIFAFPSFL
jgi:hypothetical protein